MDLFLMMLPILIYIPGISNATLNRTVTLYCAVQSSSSARNKKSYVQESYKIVFHLAYDIAVMKGEVHVCEKLGQGNHCELMVVDY